MKGFSLLEILVTIAIFSFGVLALAGTQVLNLKGIGFNKDASIATALAQRQLENLRNSTFTSVVSNSSGITQGNMNVSWDVTTFGAAPNRYKDVVLTVSWEGKSISCATIIAEP